MKREHIPASIFTGLLLVAAALHHFVSEPTKLPIPSATPLPASIPAAAPSTKTAAPALTEKSTRPNAEPVDPRSAGSPLAAELNAPGRNPAQDLDTLHMLLRQYLRHLHNRQGRPIGNDSDLAWVLRGNNPMKLVVIPPGHPALTPDGHLRDRWGTPYFIHPLGNNAFDIRSAGPDRKLFTQDDVIRDARAAAEQEIGEAGEASDQ